MAALGGGFGLKAMFRNGEVSAQAAGSPPRFLLSHWPVGIVAGNQDALFKPTAGAAGGHALQTFADNGLADDMITIRSAGTNNLPLNGGGGSEAGLVVLVTGVGCGGTRANRGESDDGFAAGPSIEQYLLAKVPALRAPGGPGYANAICDARTDLGEISTKCLSYSTDTQPVPLYLPAGGVGTENVPLLGELSPFMQYGRLFSGMAPGAGGQTGAAGAAGQAGPSPAADAILKQLALRRSVLDFSLQEINRMSALVPGSSRDKLRIHFDAVEQVEKGLTAAIQGRHPVVTGTGGSAGISGVAGAGGGVGGTGGAGGGPAACAPGAAPPADIAGPPDWTAGGHGNYGNPKNGSTDDIQTHQTVGRLHMDVLRAAFVCDLIRCGTFQWSPSTNHVGFKGLFPGDEAGIYQHHPASHSGGSNLSENIRTATTPGELTNPTGRFLFNVQTWYFARHAENLKLWKEAVDGSGNPLLGTTIVAYTTENADYANARDRIPWMLFGGTKLGLKTGQYVPGLQTSNKLFGTIAQAFGYTSTNAPLGVPIPGLWSDPAGG